MGTIGITILAAALGLTAVAQAGEVASALEVATKTYRSKGYSPAGWEQMGRLANAADTRLVLPLKGGHSYQIVAVCERKCTDLDLQLFDAAGKEVDWDAQDDNFPIVATYAQATQDYTLRVAMSACGQTQCAFGVKAFVKN
ncbi:hypothetical protein OF829_13955 [Sphingomonas sp. LB-2]|uniref:hypothetical protein n=1 Tax=Sphingomonas caeni TaxID=2984949 RepID=UPI00222F29B4|nr:hypothetical protein [Sphingomonas caeni]MCW3848345.1 hypothetical protein [Sphingomonas caeni]